MHIVLLVFSLQYVQYPESLLGDSPSVMTMQILPKVSDSSVAKRLVECLLSAMRTTGEHHVITKLIIKINGQLRMILTSIYHVFFNVDVLNVL